MNPAVRLIQIALSSMGYRVEADGWIGPNTLGAINEMLAGGPVGTSQWAIETLARGLDGMGYLSGPHPKQYEGKLHFALMDLALADGTPKAEAISATGATVGSTELKPAAHTNELRQGKAGYLIDTIMMHCTALPGDWHKGRSDYEIAKAIYHMHTDPESKGGRGWSDTGYHAIITPRGAVLNARPLERIGAGAIRHNHGVFHFVMVEVKTIKGMGQPEDFFTPETIATAKKQIEQMCQRTQIKYLKGHNEVAAKLCPGFIVNDRDWTDRRVA